MAQLMNDGQVVERILAHIDQRTTDLGERTWREPVEHYRSQARLDTELRQVLRRTATPFCPSAALPGPGAYIAREAAGTPILAVRGEDGRVRAFRNACRHRGLPVASGSGDPGSGVPGSGVPGSGVPGSSIPGSGIPGSGVAKSFVCGYHGWAYRLDGSLRHIPHEHGFPGLDKERHGLVPVQAVERHGMVFVTQDGTAAPDEALQQLANVISPEQQLFACTERTVAANWKIVLEGLIEGYHIRATHPETFLPYGFDNLNVVETFGRNSRVTYPFQRIEKLRGAAPQDLRVDGLLTYVYHLFPNAFITVLSRHTNVVALEPVALDCTKMVSYTLTNRGADQQEMLREARRDAAFVGEKGAAEDRAVAAAIQRGLASGANEAFTYGRFESAIVNFHGAMQAAFAPGAPQTALTPEAALMPPA